jgi:hypothetical protein
MVLEHPEQLHSPPVVRVNRDEIRLALGFKFDAKREKEVTAIQDQNIAHQLNLGCTVISDDTYLNPAHIEQRRQQAAQHDVAFLVNNSFMNVSVEECIKRDLLRESSVGKDVIEQLYFRYWSFQPKPENIGPATAILCDLDGTLALFGNANPYERDFSKDVLNEAVAHILKNYRYGYAKIILMSGRNDKFQHVTQKWLFTHDIPYSDLIMRPDGAVDDRGRKIQDVVLKKQMYMDYVQGCYTVLFVLDDRPSVVRMWRAECNLTVFQVSPNLEF